MALKVSDFERVTRAIRKKADMPLCRDRGMIKSCQEFGMARVRYPTWGWSSATVPMADALDIVETYPGVLLYGPLRDKDGGLIKCSK